MKAVLGIKTGFIRTPKHKVESGADAIWKGKNYRRKRGLLPLLELSFAAYFVLAIAYAIRMEMWGTIPFLLLFRLGYGDMGVMSFVQTIDRACYAL